MRRTTFLPLAALASTVGVALVAGALHAQEPISIPGEFSYLGKTKFRITPGAATGVPVSVTIGGIAVKGLTVTAAEITGTVPAYQGRLPPSPVDVVVGRGRDLSTILDGVEYVWPFEVKSAGPVPICGGQTTIQGLGFTPSTNLVIGGHEILQTDIEFVDARTLRCPAPVLPAGTYDVEAIDNLLGVSVRHTLNGAISYVPSVAITGVDPGVVDAFVATEILIRGEGFGAKQVFRIDGSPLQGQQILSSTRATGETPALAPGTYDLEVVSPEDCNLDVFEDAIVVRAIPQISRVIPTQVSTVGGQAVAVDGIHFTEEMELEMVDAGTRVLEFNLQGPNRLLFTAPAHPPGFVDLQIRIGGAVADVEVDALEYVTSPPTIARVTPSQTSTEGGETIIIEGTNFTPDMELAMLNGGTIPLEFTLRSFRSLTFVAPSHAPGFVGLMITIEELEPVVAEDVLEYVSPPLPTITEITPNETSTEGGETITVDGMNFTSDMELEMIATGLNPDVVALQFVLHGPNRISFAAPAHAPGFVLLRIRVAGEVVAVSPETLEYVSPPPPAITEVTPNETSTEGGETITVDGMHFTSDMELEMVDAGANPSVISLQFTLHSPNRVSFAAPAHAPGFVTLRIRVGGEVVAVSPETLEYVSPPLPAITEVTPNETSTEGGETITVDGMHFTSDMELEMVDAGANPSVISLQFTLHSPNRVSFAAPAHAPGFVTLRIRVGGEVVAVSPETLEYVSPPLPAITEVTPNETSTEGGETITVDGMHFTSDMELEMVDAGANPSVTSLQFTLHSPESRFVRGASACTGIHRSSNPRRGDRRVRRVGSASVHRPAEHRTIHLVGDTERDEHRRWRAHHRHWLQLQTEYGARDDRHRAQPGDPDSPVHLSPTLGGSRSSRQAIVRNGSISESESAKRRPLRRGALRYVDPLPVVEAVLPFHLSGRGGMPMVIRGKYFTPEMSLTLVNPREVDLEFDYVSSTEVHAIAPATEHPGYVDMVARRNPLGEATVADDVFEYTDPAAPGVHQVEGSLVEGEVVFEWELLVGFEKIHVYPGEPAPGDPRGECDLLRGPGPHHGRARRLPCGRSDRGRTLVDDRVLDRAVRMSPRVEPWRSGAG